MSLRRQFPPSRTAPAVGSAFGDVSAEEPLQDPAGLLAELQDEQRRIADELEDTFAAYDRKLQGAAKRIASLGADCLTPSEWDRLRAEQLELWRLLRRAQAAQRSTRALAREVAEWRVSDSGTLPEGHPDHPETRAEIVESELRVRGVFASVAREIPAALLEEVSAPSVDVADEERVGDMAVVASESVVEDASIAAPAPDWAHEIDDDVLLREIHGYEKELSRAHAPADIADLLRSLRHLHAHLRLSDRRNGRPRVRFALGFPAIRH